jgi:hypothetical protein
MDWQRIRGADRWTFWLTLFGPLVPLFYFGDAFGAHFP